MTPDIAELTEPSDERWDLAPTESEQTGEFTVMVPIANPQTQQHLIELAASLARYEGGRVIPLAIVQARDRMDAPEMDDALQSSQLLLERATERTLDLGVKVLPQQRIEYDVARGISHASREQNASLLLMGWGKRQRFRGLFDSITDRVLWASHCLVAVTRLQDSPRNIQRILVPVENLTTASVRPVRFAQILAEINQAQVTLLHICDPKTTSDRIHWIHTQLSAIISQLTPNPPEIEIKIQRHEDVTQAILNTAQSFDLVVLRSRRRRVGADGLAISEVTAPLIWELTCSIVLLGEPQGKPTNVLVGNS
jgi:nucleotide-binding universal stress UspA family protein